MNSSLIQSTEHTPLGRWGLRSPRTEGDWVWLSAAKDRKNTDWNCQKQNYCDENKWPPALERCLPATSLRPEKQERYSNEEHSAPHLIGTLWLDFQKLWALTGAMELSRKQIWIYKSLQIKPFQIAHSLVPHLGPLPPKRQSLFFVLFIQHSSIK